MLRIHNLKPRCIHCKRNVGTHFEKNGGVYKANCGDSTDPCKLNIEINTGYHTNIVKQIGFTLGFIHDSKDQMLKYKMDSLFEYEKDDVITKLFEKLNEDFELERFSYKELVDLYNESFYNKKTEASLEKMKSELFEYNEELQIHLSKYSSENNREFLAEAMKIYTNQILPLHQKMYHSKYKVIEIIHENNKPDLQAKTRLHTQQTTLSDMTLDINEDTAVKHFEV